MYMYISLPFIPLGESGHTLLVLVHPKPGKPDAVKRHRLKQCRSIYIHYHESHVDKS